MFYLPSNTARTHAHTSISTLKSLVNFCSRDFPFHKEINDSTLAKRHIVVGHFVRSVTGHVMQDIGVTRHSRITQHLVPSTTALSFVCCSQFACKKKSFSRLSVRPSYFRPQRCFDSATFCSAVDKTKGPNLPLHQSCSLKYAHRNSYFTHRLLMS